MSQPSYVALLESGEFGQRVESLMEMLRICRVCPRDCDNDRLNNEVAACYSGLLPIVSTYTAHFGEEPALVGTNGAGNVFLGLCNLRCVYCQNYQISQTFKEQRKNEVSFERLAEIFIELQEQGCHNINWVSPTHFAPQLAKSLFIAAGRGLRLPVVYNTNAYDSVEVLRLLDGIVDVYLPDLKYSTDEAGREYSKVTEYTHHSRAALKEMYRQMGHELEYDGNGLLKRGLIVRLLVLPNDIAGIAESLQWIRDEMSSKVAVSLMAQYFPTNKVGLERYPLISRKIRWSEWLTAVEQIESLGMEEGWMQDFDSAAEYYRPDFGNKKTPFSDIVDFQKQ
ncbi:MAG TPA: radical SAM protein [Blastocatellia bacterium]|jgi:putative pyruvate formate lyase activating enzyme|nr:radical SAM protein [Blastocatellia bacterium]